MPDARLSEEALDHLLAAVGHEVHKFDGDYLAASTAAAAWMERQIIWATDCATAAQKYEHKWRVARRHVREIKSDRARLRRERDWWMTYVERRVFPQVAALKNDLKQAREGRHGASA